MKRPKLGTITIGQAPRPELTAVFDAALGPDLPRRHVAMLEGLRREDIDARFAPRPGAPVLVARLLDGAVATLDKATAEIALRWKIDTLEQEGCTSIVPLCDAEFMLLHGRRGAWVTSPLDTTLSYVAALSADDRQVGVLVPPAELARAEERGWGSLPRRPAYEAACPYAEGDGELAKAARALRGRGAEVLVAHDLSFVERQRRIASEASGLPVVLSSAIVAEVVASTLCGGIELI